jgi:uncharacterized membrane protein
MDFSRRQPMQTYNFTTLDDPSGTNTAPFGINNSGEIVGGYLDGHNHGFLYDIGTYTTIDPPVTVGTVALGINNKGAIVGGAYYDVNGTTGRGFLDVNGTFTAIDDPFADSGGTFATGINNKGEIATTPSTELSPMELTTRNR